MKFLHRSATKSAQLHRSIDDLEKFTREHASDGSMQTFNDLIQYENSFDALIKELHAFKITLNRDERGAYFWTGLPFTTRRRIKKQLLATSRMERRDILPRRRKDAMKAIRHIFQEPQTPQWQPPKFFPDALEQFVCAHAVRSMRTFDAFVQYKKNFDSITRGFIVDKISYEERDLYFWMGLPFGVRRCIKSQLEICTTKIPERVPSRGNAIKAARFVFLDPTLPERKTDRKVEACLETIRGLVPDTRRYHEEYYRLASICPSAARALPRPWGGARMDVALRQVARGVTIQRRGEDIP
ncbi:hypothetical protein P691DRAFT_784138 [Macrolepiota fuliginosa MF-IS2]|uniref:Uncharacterized protein n=1 Tax=Macrolepiota fuliginosa MF-IS2 TaxID=1400762 RepID=A0A9P5XBG4_9AGAR|nr:hypothetical protein P691DRAFT_784138 [Macrolepiota fuliginosa MF-IS2]